MFSLLAFAAVPWLVMGHGRGETRCRVLSWRREPCLGSSWSWNCPWSAFVSWVASGREGSGHLYSDFELTGRQVRCEADL